MCYSANMQTNGKMGLPLDAALLLCMECTIQIGDNAQKKAILDNFVSIDVVLFKFSW